MSVATYPVGIMAIYKNFPGLEEIYPQEEVGSILVKSLKGVKGPILTYGVPGVIVLPGSTTRNEQRIKGERLDVDDKGMVRRQIGLGDSLMNSYGLLDAIRRFSPVGDAAYAVLIQGRCLTIFQL